MMFGSNVNTSDTTHALGKYEEALPHVNFQFVFLLHIFLLLGDVFHVQFIHMICLEIDKGN